MAPRFARCPQGSEGAASWFLGRVSGFGRPGAADMLSTPQLDKRHIVLGLSGGIACYKAAELTRALVKAGASVQVVMTEAAEAFITPVTMQALSHRPVFTSQWDARADNNTAHLTLTRAADAVLA